MITKLCAILAVVLVIIVCGCWYFGKYCNYKQRCLNKISFQKFLEIYKNAPDKIYLDEGYVSYYENGVFLSNHSDAFYFSIPDTFRYEHFRKEKDRKDEEMRIRKSMEAVNKAWEEDAENYKKEQMKNGN